jgi:biopolymer transport protein ExbB
LKTVRAAVLALVFACAVASFPSARAGLSLSDEGAAGPREEEQPLIVGEDESLWRLFWKGGLVMPAILAASVVGLAFAIERAAALRAPVQAPDGLAEEAALRLSRGGPGAARALVGGKDSALARMLDAALVRLAEGRRAMEESAGAAAERALYDLRRNVRPLGVVASVSPLLGLLGTVWGMIRAFDAAGEVGLGRGAELARGIGEALITTGAGLLVAIPALLFYHFFRARSEDLVRKAEGETAGFIDKVSGALRPGKDEGGGKEGGGGPANASG